MFKKEKPKSYTHFIYTVYDSVSRKYRGTFYHSTDEEMIKIALPTILYDFPLRDIEIRKIGTFNENTGVIQSITPVVIPTDCYTFPHSRLSSVGDDLPLEELEQAMKEQKSELLAKLSENKNSSVDEQKKKEA